jgi:hypothetical protein
MSDRRVAIIGAGPAGLATARALKALAIPFVIYEKHGNVGGIWNAESEGSPMYGSAHFISSRTMSGHEAFPMPDDYPDYPSNKQILEYIESFAKHYGLLEHIVFNTTVEIVEEQSSGWSLTVATRSQASVSEFFSWVVCASGTNWHKSQPYLKGQESFLGQILHSVDYHDSSSLTGQRVLVVGAGNSGIDIACDAAFKAEKAYLSLRRGYHFVPKHIFGMPADVFGAQSSWMPMRLQQLIFGGLLRLLNGDLSRLGLQKPDHRVLSSHPILNSQLLHYLQHGDITAMHDIDYLDGRTAYFKNGRSAEVDKIILATGYHWRLPYLDPNIYSWQSNRPQAFMKIFNAKHPSLFINGFVETNGGAYKMFDDMAYLIARSIYAQASNGRPADKLKAFISGPEPDLSGRVRYVKSDRHAGYTNAQAYASAMSKMRKHLGWPDANHAFYKRAE